jgi:hypothetical protein
MFAAEEKRIENCARFPQLFSSFLLGDFRELTGVRNDLTHHGAFQHITLYERRRQQGASGPGNSSR